MNTISRSGITTGVTGWTRGEPSPLRCPGHLGSSTLGRFGVQANVGFREAAGLGGQLGVRNLVGSMLSGCCRIRFGCGGCVYRGRRCWLRTLVFSLQLAPSFVRILGRGLPVRYRAAVASPVEVAALVGNRSPSRM